MGTIVKEVFNVFYPLFDHFRWMYNEIAAAWQTPLAEDYWFLYRWTVFTWVVMAVLFSARYGIVGCSVGLLPIIWVARGVRVWVANRGLR